MKRNHLYSYLISSSLLYFYTFIASVLFDNGEEAIRFDYPFHINFENFRFYGFPTILINGAILYAILLVLLRKHETWKYSFIYTFVFSILCSYLYTTFFFEAPLFSLPFFILLFGGVLFMLGYFVRKTKSILTTFVLAVCLWLSLMILPPII
jgi:hypothetical protein